MSSQWNELKTNIPTNLNNTKIVEPINCKKYVIDTITACSLLYAGDDVKGKREAVLAIAFDDRMNMTHLIVYTTDAEVFDQEQPVLNHILDSYRLTNNTAMIH